MGIIPLGSVTMLNQIRMNSLAGSVDSQCILHKQRRWLVCVFRFLRHRITCQWFSSLVFNRPNGSHGDFHALKWAACRLCLRIWQATLCDNPTKSAILTCICLLIGVQTHYGLLTMPSNRGISERTSVPVLVQITEVAFNSENMGSLHIARVRKKDRICHIWTFIAPNKRPWYVMLKKNYYAKKLFQLCGQQCI